MKYELIIILFLMSGCASQLERINSEVNSYGYQPDPKGQDDRKRMSPTQKGDCDDHVYTKGLMINERLSGKELHFLYRTAEQTKLATSGRHDEAHAALMVDGLVLDNLEGAPYAFKRSEWLYSVACGKDCADIDLGMAIIRAPSGGIGKYRSVAKQADGKYIWVAE